MLNNVSGCPFCKSNPRCDVNGQVPCWCFSMDIPDELLDCVPESLKGRVCVCSSCVALFKGNETLFKSKYI